MFGKLPNWYKVGQMDKFSCKGSNNNCMVCQIMEELPNIPCQTFLLR